MYISNTTENLKVNPDPANEKRNKNDASLGAHAKPEACFPGIFQIIPHSHFKIADWLHLQSNLEDVWNCIARKLIALKLFRYS